MKNAFANSLVLKSIFALIASVTIGLGGPYGTFEAFQTVPRLTFWVAAIVVPWLLWETLYSFALQHVPAEFNRRVLMALLMPLFATIGSAFVTFLSVQSGFLGTTRFLQAWPMSIVSWLVFSFAIVLPLILIGDELSRRQRKTGGLELLTFLTEKISPKLRGAQLIAIKSEDHYLRIYTTLGDDLILMSMQDALTALSGYPGVRTHRSWWVALDQVQPIMQKSKTISKVRLLSGLDVPVSRRRAKAVYSKLNTVTQ